MATRTPRKTASPSSTPDTAQAPDTARKTTRRARAQQSAELSPKPPTKTPTKVTRRTTAARPAVARTKGAPADKPSIPGVGDDHSVDLASPSPSHTPPAAPLTGAGLLKAGLKAVTGQNPLFETLLDLDAARRRKTKELFQIKTFEDLFNERVARALGSLDVIKSLDQLREQLAAIDKRLQALEVQQKPHGKRTKR